MLSQSGIDETHVGQNLGGIGNSLDNVGSEFQLEHDKEPTNREKIERLFKVLIVVGLEGRSPSFEFGFERHGCY